MLALGRSSRVIPRRPVSQTTDSLAGGGTPQKDRDNSACAPAATAPPQIVVSKSHPREDSFDRSPSLRPRDSSAASDCGGAAAAKTKRDAVYVCPKFAPRRTSEGSGLSFSFSKGDLTLHVPMVAQSGQEDVENRKYKFSHTFGPKTKERDVFVHLWREAESRLLHGYNATLLCYGQTGSGKTYTLNHLLPSMTEACFDWVQREQAHGAHFTTEVSYLQIYMDTVYDLLSGSKEQSRGTTLDHKGKTLDALPKNFVGVRSAAEAVSLVKRGNKYRATNQHALNDKSSRSHTLFFLTLTRTTKGSSVSTQSTLLLVDLAGSERAHKTKAKGSVFEEGKSINMALTTLGRVMEGLSKGDRSIPYRENILTMYLKETLTNSFFSLICCCSSDARDSDETRCTLNFGSVAKQVVISRKTNELLKAREAAKKQKDTYDQTLASIEKHHGEEVGHLSKQLEENYKKGEMWKREATQMHTKLHRERAVLQDTENKLAGLAAALAEKEKEAEVSLMDLAMIQEKYEELFAEIKAEQQARKEAETRADSLNRKLDRTTSDLRKLTAKVEDLQAQLGSKVREVDTAKESSQQAQLQLHEKQGELVDVRRRLTHELAEGHAALQQREAELMSEVVAAEDELTRAKSRLADMQHEKAELQKGLAVVEDESHELKHEHQLLSDELASLRRTKSLLHESVANLHEECSSLRRDREKALEEKRTISQRMRAKEQEAERLRKEAESVVKKADAEMKQAKKLQKQLAVAEQRRVEAERDISLMEREVLQAETRLEALESRNKEKQGKISTLEERLAHEREQHRSDLEFLQEKLDEVEAQNASAERTRLELLEGNEHLAAERARVVEEKSRVESEMAALRAERDGLREEVRTAGETLRAEKARAFRIQEHSNDLEVQLATEAEDKARLEEHAEVLVEEHAEVLAQVEDELEKERQDRERLQNGYNEVADEVLDVREQLADAQHKYMTQLDQTSAAQAEQKRLGSLIVDAEGQLHTEQEETTRLRSEMNIIQTELKSAALTDQKKRVLELEGELQEMNDLHMQAETLAEQRSKKCGELSLQCVREMDALERARHELEAADSRIQELNAANRKMLSDKAQLQKDNERMRKTELYVKKKEEEVKRLTSQHQQSAFAERRINKLDYANRKLVDKQREEKLEAKRLAEELRQKELDLKKIYAKYQRDCREREKEKETSAVKISRMEEKISRMKADIDNQTTTVKEISGRVRESEAQRDVLRNVLDHNNKFHYRKRSPLPSASSRPAGSRLSGSRADLSPSGGGVSGVGFGGVRSSVRRTASSDNAPLRSARSTRSAARSVSSEMPRSVRSTEHHKPAATAATRPRSYGGSTAGSSSGNIYGLPVPKAGGAGGAPRARTPSDYRNSRRVPSTLVRQRSVSPTLVPDSRRSSFALGPGNVYGKPVATSVRMHDSLASIPMARSSRRSSPRTSCSGSSVGFSPPARFAPCPVGSRSVSRSVSPANSVLGASFAGSRSPYRRPAYRG